MLHSCLVCYIVIPQPFSFGILSYKGSWCKLLKFILCCIAMPTPCRYIFFIFVQAKFVFGQGESISTTTTKTKEFCYTRKCQVFDFPPLPSPGHPGRWMILGRLVLRVFTFFIFVLCFTSFQSKQACKFEKEFWTTENGPRLKLYFPI